MKLNRFLILSVILVILTVGAVSAEDNATLDDSQIAEDIGVSFPEKVYEEDPVDIEVNLPENAQGNLKATVDEVEIYNEKIVNKSVRIPVTIPESKLPYIVVNRMTDHTSHKIGVFYNDIALDIPHDLKLMKYRPEHDYGSGIPQEILKDDNSTYQTPSLIFPETANGTVEICIDGVSVEKLNTTIFTHPNISNFNSLELGNHTARVIYSGDDYYLSSDRTFNFTVVDMIINIPKNIVLEHDDCLTAKTLKNRNGTLKVFIDSKLALTGKLDKNGEFLESLFKYVKCGQQWIEVQYTAGNFTKSKRVLANVSYYVEAWGNGFIYGDEDDVVIVVPTDFNKDLIDIRIDGVKVKKFTIDNSGWIELDVSKLSAGNHTISFDFKGDEKYYSYSLTHSFTICYGIKVPDWFADEYTKVSLTLPSNAKGTLKVYVDGKLFKSQKLNKGKASISLAGLKAGYHNITAKYTGSDFKVDKEESEIYVPLKPTIKAKNAKAYYTDAAKYSVKIMKGPKAAGGMYVSLKICKRTYGKYANKNGVATFNLPKLKPGKYTLTLICDGVKVTKKLTVKQILSLNTAKIKRSAKKVVLSVTLKKGKKPVKGKYVIFKFKGKSYKAKTNSKGIAKVTVKKSVLKKLKVGRMYTYSVSYLKTSIIKTTRLKR
ncbi:Ig-like domain-containing protein [Methanobrevibacter sp.]|uniref:Ig-like domain-containing protein n=1 Tax=Methanobrevibacter sp. TaxID=66852 RepID=UPI00386C3360